MRVIRCLVTALVLVLVLVLAHASRSGAQTPDPSAVALQMLFASPSVHAMAFTDGFVAQVPPKTIAASRDDFRGRLGALSSISKSGTDYAVAFAHGAVLATIALAPDGKIAGLVFHDETSEVARAAIVRVFTEATPPADVFSAAFLAQIPSATLSAVTAQILAQEGKFVRLDTREGAYYAVFERADNHVLATTDAAGRFTALRILPPVTRTSSLDDALSKLRERNGDVSYLIIEGRTDVAALSADRPMAVGSAFKLVILAALRDEIDAKRRAWSDVVPLPARAKSLPSGILQTWPDETPITLATYAAQMISVSDNTAADVLAGVVGRSALEAISPRNAPFLTTREMFTLKTKGNDVRAAFRVDDLAARRAIVTRLDAQTTPLLQSLELEPAYLDIEWNFTNRERCTLMERVHDLDLTTINPGIANPHYARISYKGGSDAGVLNLTSYVTTPERRSYCVSATWNDRTRALDEPAFAQAYGAVLERLAAR